MKRNRVPTLIFWLVFLPVLGFIVYGVWAMFVAFPRFGNRAACMVNIRNVQQAIRKQQAEHKLSSGHPFSIEELTKAGLITRINKCFDGNSYTTLDRVPVKGELYLRCSDPEHIPPGHENW